MKTENYTKKDGQVGKRYVLEKGDVVKAVVSSPRQSQPGKCKYPAYSIKAVWNDNEIFVTLTNGQYKRLMGMGNLEGRKLAAVGYDGPSDNELIGIELLE